MALTNEDIQTVRQMIADQFDNLEQTVDALAAKAIGELTPEVVREQVRNVLTEDGAAVDNDEDVPVEHDPAASTTMMPAVEYDEEGNASRYVRVPVNTLTRLSALLVDSKHIGVVTDTLGAGDVELQPNILYVDDDDGYGKPSTHITLAEGDFSGDVAEYMIRVCVQSEDREVVFPDDIRWPDGEPPVFETGVAYEISIVDGLAVYAEWEP